jgi:hypothetical protein
MNTKQRLEDRYRMGKIDAAAVILADVEMYGGESSLLVKLARAVLEGTPPNNSLEEPLAGTPMTSCAQLQGAKTEGAPFYSCKPSEFSLLCVSSHFGQT